MLQQRYEKLRSYAQRLANKCATKLTTTELNIIGKFVIARIKAEELFDFRNRIQLFENSLLESLNSDKPLTFFLSRCLRYYYPKGQLAIIDHCYNHKYRSFSGINTIKEGEKLLNELVDDFELPILLQRLGFNVEIIMPVMDSELRRPKEMNTAENRILAQNYAVNLQNMINQIDEFKSLNITVLLSTELFDFDSEYQNRFFEDVKRAIQYSNSNDYGIANYMFEAEVGRVTGVFRDPERLSKYNQNEFPRERVLYNTCDGVYMATQMTKLAPISAGVFALMPKRGEYISKVYEVNRDLCVYMPRSE